MSIRYKEEFKKIVVEDYMRGEKSIAKIAADYNISKSSVLSWAEIYGEECQHTTNKNAANADAAKEIRLLNQKIKEQQKEIEFLKKAAAFFAKEID